MLLLGATLCALTGCDDVLEDLSLDIGFYGVPGYSWSGTDTYYEDTYVEEYWYEETYYEDAYYEDTSYVDDWSFWPW
jgi:hypothetical protein